MSKFLKVGLKIFVVLIVSCLLAAINQYQAASGVIPNRLITFQFTFVLYFIGSIIILTLSQGGLKRGLVLSIIFFPEAFLTIFGLIVNWYDLFPYFFPAQTITVLVAQALAYFALKQSFVKKSGIYFSGSIMLFLVCFSVFGSSFENRLEAQNKAFIHTYDKNIGTSLAILKQELIDTSGRHLSFDNKNYYLLNFSFHNCSPCQIKLDFLKKFALDEAPANLKVIYISTSKIETFSYYKSTLKPDKSDRIIYAYLDDKILMKRLNINKYPDEIMVGPDFKFLRVFHGFYLSDANFYKQSTLKLIKQ